MPLKSVAGARCVSTGLEPFDPPRDLLPGADTVFIAQNRECADLLGDVDWRLISVPLEDRAGAGPELPFAQRHRWPRQ